ncbi:protein phosphatase 2C domain-containing protein [Streptomyces flavofungini]|uniref:protein phosphatase 2C domain-containing protein n=1 Tax=Streptomyces flavofungini TaxID=68200 RepID=UPI001E2DA7B4
MSQQGERHTGPGARSGQEDDWWGQLYDDSKDDTGPATAPDTLDDRFASASDTVACAAGGDEGETAGAAGGGPPGAGAPDAGREVCAAGDPRSGSVPGQRDGAQGRPATAPDHPGPTQGQPDPAPDQPDPAQGQAPAPDQRQALPDWLTTSAPRPPQRPTPEPPRPPAPEPPRPPAAEPPRPPAPEPPRRPAATPPARPAGAPPEPPAAAPPATAPPEPPAAAPPEPVPPEPPRPPLAEPSQPPAATHPDRPAAAPPERPSSELPQRPIPDSARAPAPERTQLPAPEPPPRPAAAPPEPPAAAPPRPPATGAPRPPAATPPPHTTPTSPVPPPLAEHPAPTATSGRTEAASARPEPPSPPEHPAPAPPTRPNHPPAYRAPAPWAATTASAGPVTFPSGRQAEPAGASTAAGRASSEGGSVSGSSAVGGAEREDAEVPLGVPAYVGDGPPTYEAEPTGLPVADPDELRELVADTVLDGARYGTSTVRAASVRGDSARFRGEPRRDALLTARFGTGEDALVLVAMATGARATPGAHRAAADVCAWIGRAVGRSHARLAQDIRAARRGDLKSGLHRLTDRSLGKLRARAAELGLEPDEYTATLRCLLLPADPDCRTRVFFGVGAGGLFRLRGGEWQDIEPRTADATGEAVVGFGSPPPAETPDGDRLTMDLGITTPPSPYEPAPAPPRDPFRFRASVARPGDTLLLCSGGLAEPLRGEPELARHLTRRWAEGGPPGLAAFLADTQVRVKGYADDRTAAAVWEA